MRKGFTLHHNGPPANCLGRPHDRCQQFWRAVRDYHTNPEPIGQGWSDIAYSFGVCPHGIPFEGRGWTKRQFANGSDLVPPNDGDDSQWYTILAFVGGGPGTGYENEPPTPAMIARIRALISEGRTSGRCGLAVKPHNDFKKKPCPGVELTAWAEEWDGKAFTQHIPMPVLEEDNDMRIIDCQGKPAIIVFGNRTYEPINVAQRNAWRSAGVPAGLVTVAERSEILAFLEDTP